MRVLLADDHPLALAAVRVLLEGAADLEVVGEARSGSQVLPRAREAKPDIVVLDLNLPELDGLTCLERLTAEFPKAAVVVCSGEANEDDVEAVRLGGARAFVAKAGDPDEIPVALRAAAAGEPFRVYGAPERRRRPNEDLGLSERETTLLQTLARGRSGQRRRGRGEQLRETASCPAASPRSQERGENRLLRRLGSLRRAHQARSP